MEWYAQEQNFLNPTNTNLTSNSETEDPITRLSSCSSSSYCSSIETEPKPNQNLIDQSPPTQIMQRSTDNNNNTTTMTSSPKTPQYKIPSHVFARTTSTAPVEWSTMSNESLFSIYMGNNNSFTDYFKSEELTFPQPPSPITPPLPSSLQSQPNNTNQEGGGVVEEAKTPVDISKKSAETEKAYRASKEEEQKAATSISEVIMANEATNKDNKNKTNKLDMSASRRKENLSVKSFAFPVLGDADKGGLQGTVQHKKQSKPLKPETPKISNEVKGDEGLKKEEVHKSVNPKGESDRACNPNIRWLSYFSCCTTCCGSK